MVVGLFSPTSDRSKVYVGGKYFSVEVADTDASRARGLSGHDPLGSSEGMFFIFEKLDKHEFWMKNMTFPIDIIWIDTDFKITHIEKSVSPDTYPKTFYPNTPSLYVLEISAGQSEQLGLKISDTLVFAKSK